MDNADGIRNPVVQWLVYGHVWLGLCVAAQIGWTGLYLRDAPDLWRYMVAAAVGTIAIYGLMRWVRAGRPRVRSSAHLAWTLAHRRTLLVISVAGLALATALCWPPRWLLLRWLLPAGLLAFLYVSPFTARDGLTIGLRRVPLIKIILIALAWTLAVVAAPMEFDASEHPALNTLFLMCMRMPLFMGLSIAFDIRDARLDPPVLRTVPQLLGVRGARVLAVLLLLYSAGLEHVSLHGLRYEVASWSVLVGYAYAIVLLLVASPDRREPFYGIGVDGAMVLIPLCVWLGMLA